MMTSLLLSLALVAGITIDFSEGFIHLDLFKNQDLKDPKVYSFYKGALETAIRRNKLDILPKKIVLAVKIASKDLVSAFGGIDTVEVFEDGSGRGCTATFGTRATKDDAFECAQNPIVSTEIMTLIVYGFEVFVSLTYPPIEFIFKEFKRVQEQIPIEQHKIQQILNRLHKWADEHVSEGVVNVLTKVIKWIENRV